MKKVFATLFVMLLLPGCVSAPKAPFVPSTGWFCTDIKAPLSTEYNHKKVVRTFGQASTTHVAYYIFSFAIGDASLNKAMKDGMLENAEYADYEWFSLLGIYGKLKVNVYGAKRPEEE